MSLQKAATPAKRKAGWHWTIWERTSAQARMKNKIHYSPESRRDLDDIWDYIVLELQNRSAAERVIDRIMDVVDPLKKFAEMGTPLSSIADVGTDYRFLVSGNYIVFYRVQGCDVYIDRVLYGRSDYMSSLFKDSLREETTE